MKKLLITLLLGLSIINLVGCGESHQDNTYELQYNPPMFSLDTNTISKDDIELVEQSNKEENTEHEIVLPDQEDIGVGEVVLENADSSISYEIVNDSDIVYNDTTFIGLYTILNNIESKYDVNNLINFIVKTYNVNVDTIYSRYEKDSTDAYSDENMTIDDQLSEYANYIQIKDRYNGADANWKITLMDANRGHRAIICGCYDYIVIIGVDNDVTVDMNEFNTETVEENTETVEESEDNNEESENNDFSTDTSNE